MTLHTGTRRIVVIEPDDSLAAALEYVVRQGGFSHVRIAAPHAIAHIAATLPDLVLLDAAHPGAGAEAICRAIRQDPACARVRIVMLTPRGSRQARSRALAAGADGSVPKPFDLAALRAEMRRVLGAADAIQRMRER